MLSNAIDVHDGIEEKALTHKADPMVKARPTRVIGAHVPFAHKARFIARAPQQLGKGHEFVTDKGQSDAVVINDAVGVGILSRQKAGPAGRA